VQFMFEYRAQVADDIKQLTFVTSLLRP